MTDSSTDTGEQRAAAAPHLQVIWTDPVTGRQGFVVIDRLVRGVSSGGLRMRSGCTLAEVQGLAAGMTRKEALHYDPRGKYVPLGGAKGGIDCAPEDPGARAMLVRYLDAVRAIIERHWTTGEDLGLRQDTIDEAITEIGLTSSVQAIYPLLDNPARARRRLADAFEVTVDEVSLPELVGGLGVAQSALTAMEHRGVVPGESRAVIQGFGSMGGATARYLAAAGVTVVGLADVRGTVSNPRGLDVERLLRGRDPLGGIDRDLLDPADRQLGVEDWLDLDCDVLVPAATSYCITPANQGRIRAGHVVEAANMPTLPEAETQLRDRGVEVIPDFVANSATNAWWWWTLFGDITADATVAQDHVRTAMDRVVSQMLEQADAQQSSPRAAAQIVVDENLVAIQERFAS
ncbi:Glu/Leu/Phe/Val dehydrogenase dimerization domain-containing protein [Leekyejoonella antrihumi]|uniref:Glutamate dehydrogenase n=1 Tax=Leekyejoonella antrihumi TaxID=1660198 RepID=A0A563E3M9_9MICO|nr:Glu/Leu/Phe/Val dehydrogenase dimerization domain-containing protein [Leekyejoonella antrihumi]TWP37015.1 glutamate dehydrogenase [Leekyejoonella antrihumi]